MRRLLLGLLPVAVLVLSACGSADEAEPGASPTSPPAEGSDGDTPGSGDPHADDALQIEVDLGDGSAPQIWTLSCAGSVEGSHPRAEAACEHLAGLEDPFAPIPEDTMCTQVYGGPQKAHVQGRWDGEPVDLQLSRVDGCRIAQWESLVPLVPAPTG